MTNKEAVEIMNIEKQCCLRNIEREAGIKDCNCDRECNKCDLLRTDAEIIEAYNVAIKALEQEPCEDAISRQAVLDINENHHGYMSNELNHQIWKEINSLSPVNPVKTGHWKLTRDEEYEYCNCSNCGYNNGENWLIGSEIPYCANCGAKMTEDNNADTN